MKLQLIKALSQEDIIMDIETTNAIEKADDGEYILTSMDDSIRLYDIHGNRLGIVRVIFKEIFDEN